MGFSSQKENPNMGKLEWKNPKSVVFGFFDDDLFFERN